MAAATNNIMAIPAAHFSHPKHELKLRESYHLPRHCDLCGDKLTGSGYSCPHRHCNFNLHEECARYPETLHSFFAHPCHDLTLSRTDGQSTSCCHLCRVKVPAGVFVYRCAPCRFAVHPGCSRLPETLRSFFAHPWHSLTLARTTDGQRVCNLCREEVPAGVFLYSCAPCGFHVHPPCSRLPRTASSEVHPEHELGLTAMPSAGAPCAACPVPCNVWVYRCGQCDVHLHIECLHGARSSRGKNEEEGPSSLGGQVMSGVETFNNVMTGVEAVNNVMSAVEAINNLWN